MYVGCWKNRLLLALMLVSASVLAVDTHTAVTREIHEKLELFCVDPVQAICTPTARQNRHRQAVDAYKKKLKEAVLGFTAERFGLSKKQVEEELDSLDPSGVHEYYFKQIEFNLKSPDIKFGNVEATFNAAINSQLGAGTFPKNVGRFVHKLRFYDTLQGAFSVDNFTALKYPLTCGKDGLKENASLLNFWDEPHNILLCPGFLAAAKNYHGEDPFFHEAPMFTILVHEASHTLDFELHRANKDYNTSRLSCLYKRYGVADPKAPWKSEKDFASFATEISADAWASEILRQRVEKIKGVWERFQFVSDSLQSLCKSEKWGTTHPIGSFRIEQIFARELGVSLGCETKSATVEPYCTPTK